MKTLTKKLPLYTIKAYLPHYWKDKSTQQLKKEKVPYAFNWKKAKSYA
jgi:hypothetical protein